MADKYEEIVSGQISGHDYVDLGLPSGNLWATCNLGAYQPHEHGDYFAWGETSPKKSYINSNYKFGEEGSYSKYCVYPKFGILDYKIVLEEKDDTARSIWGDSWFMPTQEDMIELLNYCEWWFVENYNETGVAGFVGMSKENLSTIFFPFSGICKEDKVLDYECGFYWSSSLSTTFDEPSAYGFYFYGWSPCVETCSYKARCYGCSIRAVSNFRPKSQGKILVEVNERITMRQVYGAWKGEIPTWTNVGMRCYDLYHVQVKDYSLSDIAFLIRQSLMQEFVIPVAIDILKVKPFIEVGFYAGDLLSAVLKSIETLGSYWASHDIERREVEKIFELCKDNMELYGITGKERKDLEESFEIFSKGVRE